jgi:DNA repair protein SbcC/Rad50
MLKSLHITNFQSHGKTELSFHEGTNVIIGQSDCGKTAVIRALRWIIWGRPTGDSIRSTWGGQTSVDLATEGTTVIRTKDKTDTYVLAPANGKDVTFKAIGTSVPAEISSVLNINEINFQYQLDAPFLLSSTPGEVASHFNRVAHLEKIDQGTSNVNSAIRALEQDIKYKTAEVEKHEEQLKAFEHLERFEAELEVLEGMENRLRSLKGTLEGVQLLIYDHNECSRFIDDHQNVLRDEDTVNAILDLIKQRNTLEEQANQLGNLRQNLFLIQDDIEDAKGYVEDETTVITLFDLMSKLKMANEGQKTLRKLLLDVNYNDILLNKKVAEIASLEAKWEEAMPAGSVCPVCNQIIKR